nr:RHS repeat-associated core domain-containing protein [Pseudomonas asiatica]
MYLVCTEGGHYILQTLDNLFFYFGEVPDTNSEVPLQRIENALGHFLHFTRTPDGTLTDISATGGTRVHLHYDNPLGRLTDIKRVVNNEAVETLTQYRYDEHGQLSAVINRNGDTVRSFSYAEGLMVTHSNALGLGCHYRWETLGDKPRVVEHWTSDGEHYHFRYDLDARTSWATDVLGRELEVQYNADHRVVASRDYGGERYAIELDEQGNMVGLDLPDGNRLAFKYDEYARLLEETDPLGRKTTYEYHHLTTLVTQVSYPDQVEGEEQKLYYFHTDQIGTPLEVTNSDGKIVWQATYRSWGEIEQITVSRVEQNLRFQGQYYDVETGIHYNTFRYYDSQIGRFCTQDPIGLNGGLNLYQYFPNPLSWIDPWGWMPFWKPLKPDSMAHHPFPRAHANTHGFPELGTKLDSPSWFPNEIEGSDKLYQQFHDAIKKEGVSFNKKFEGASEELVKKLNKAYEGFPQKGTLKIPRSGQVLAKDVTIGEALTKSLGKDSGNNTAGGCE